MKMGRNKMSPTDRINKLSKYSKLFEEFVDAKDEEKQKIQNEIVRDVRTIRSKVLRSLIVFRLRTLDHYNFYRDVSPKELSQQTHIGERKIVDLIKTMNMLSGIEEASFSNLQSKFSDSTSKNEK